MIPKISKKIALILFSSTIIMNAYAQWNIVYYDTTCYFFGLYFTDSITGFAVGSQPDSMVNKSLIKKTTDGGSTWTTLSLPACANSTLIDIIFTDNNHGIAVGGNGLVLITNDGGNNWTCQISNTINDLWSISFPTSNIGYAVGYRKTIIKTSDGGITWNVMNEDTTSNLLFKDVFFLTPDTGFYVCETLYRTTNGGLLWTNFDTQVYDPYGIYFINKDTGFVCGNYYAEISKTFDGGLNWNLCYDEPINTGFTSIQFVNDSVGFAIGGIGSEPLLSPGPTFIKTNDGGNTWFYDTTIFNLLYSLGYAYNSSLNSIFFINNDTGFVTIGYRGLILKTTTGGGMTNVNMINQKKERINIYPNPVNDVLYINYNQTNKSCYISITNIYGQPVLTKSLGDNNILNISFLADGIYIVQN